jgi:sporulation and cell division protein SsgA
VTAAPERDLAVPAITQYDVMSLLGPSVGGEPVVVRLRYAADDPVMVTLSLDSVVSDAPHGSWTFERRLLEVGADEPVEAGQVRVSPVWHPQGGTAVLLELGVGALPRGGRAGDPTGTVVAVVAELPSVRRFVDRIGRAVPAGTEWERLSRLMGLSDSSCFTTVE